MDKKEKMVKTEVHWGLREALVVIDGREIIVPVEDLLSSPPMEFDLFSLESDADFNAYLHELKGEGLEIAPEFMKAVDGRPINDRTKEHVIEMIKTKAAEENLYVKISADFELI